MGQGGRVEGVEELFWVLPGGGSLRFSHIAVVEDPSIGRGQGVESKFGGGKGGNLSICVNFRL